MNAEAFAGAKSMQFDGGQPFDWGRTAADYAAFRDLYPPRFYQVINDCGIGGSGQQVLDLGTGTGVLPRHMGDRGAHWMGVDISPQQTAQARQLSRGLHAEYVTSAAEDLSLAAGSLDAVTAAQCFFYFDHVRLAPKLKEWLRPGGRLLITYLSWLPAEDPVAAESEALVLKFNPFWSGGGEIFRPVDVPPQYEAGFRLISHGEERWRLPFTRQSWHGRMRACRGTGASLPPEALRLWEEEHTGLLGRIAPERFEVLHCFAYALLERP